MSTHRKKIDALWSAASASTVQQPTLSAESKRLAMLGHQNLGTGELNPIFWREDFCGVCGTQHSNPAVLDTYANCIRCQNPLRLSSHLKKRYEKLEPIHTLEILFASYGDQITENGAVDVTKHCQSLMAEKKRMDYFSLGPAVNLRKLFGLDPAPEKSKQLRIRYRLLGVFGTLMLNVASDGRVPLAMALRTPWGMQRLLQIRRAYFGHPRGTTSTGRMCYDVTELLQGLIDLRGGGSYLRIEQQEPISALLGGDPCPGYPKELRLEYELQGRSGVEVRDEEQGFLLKPLFVEAQPVIRPVIFVTSATYGMTPLARNARLLAIDKLIARADLAARKINAGDVVRREDRALVRKRPALLAEKAELRGAPVSFFDVTAQLQALVGKGGLELVLEKERFDANAAFGNPYVATRESIAASGAGGFGGMGVGTGSGNGNGIGGLRVGDGTGSGSGSGSGSRSGSELSSAGVDVVGGGADGREDRDVRLSRLPSLKLLEVHLVSVGHDSERFTSSAEASSAGQPLNYISGSPADFLIPVRDDDHGRGRLTESLVFQSRNVLPIIRINNAVYGQLADITRLVDVTTEVQLKVNGRELLLGTNDRLDALFPRDPCPGQRKQLRVDYTVLGFQGNLRIKVGLHDDRMVAGLELGFPPQVPPDI